ncbi:MAG: NAD-dependent epimerase [Acidobacteria bacterium RIFCSPLOWO2_02_FULL_67_36]|nr:MAG: NAD-dependent epimerase [Acidobacteria bacterium RIFCSPLOWO2_02_FULL_67_36]OFW20984.1 MAG: NAD-dependent epimerase [Acidobacteria bacterium RIFCSPLOWO2_12_FULL_66_21]
MTTAIVTGSAGLIGSETVRVLADRGVAIVGIDNDMRRHFFGDEASTRSTRDSLEELPSYTHFDLDVRDQAALERIFAERGKDIALVVHTAAQPSHDWAARDPQLDFSINAGATLTLLDLTRRHCPEAVFIFTSTNKVYGDTPNALPLTEQESRWEIDPSHPFAAGIDETMSIDHSLHSLFGASKVAADVLVQEFGRYFGMRTAAFRCGCLTGPQHSGAELHGFLAYLMKCVAIGRRYSVFGYKGKQVRDNIHSADVIGAFLEFWKAPRGGGQVYNMGGGRFSNCSMLEAIEKCERIAGRKLDWVYQPANRIGDHIWYISDLRRFQTDYPGWRQQYDLDALLRDIYDHNIERWDRERH